ncbi:cytochrome c oxidase subunit 7A1, mitochondrial isoform X1 [Neodiprion pinetum]|uniref:Cytochrome c oxidase subunit 7A2, mitochondrial n=1 Tax=Neodiprion lecontei TaxID=441921 RepID=A0A6J0BGW4_NEOLC|nr:cytochrome c oxidase subunit 7A2, mitochondrial isoform X1 [Neodiprion lecontei]XP_046471214.1 cytochrome c oxidase subunit 7A2, mitochondrial isoform X1 [Neodiprion pinetum]XP_046589396.1 cytochrome c oxidase subunit 7A2, mitochondrial isoform X1 [Neodiprion lecontei]
MPYYNFNSFTGRIAETTHPQPFYPLAPHRLDLAEPPKIMYDSSRTKPVQVASASTSARPQSTLSPEMLKKYQKFQAPNNIPVHLKGGPMDKILLGTTVVLIGIGLIQAGDLIYKLGFPKK